MFKFCSLFSSKGLVLLHQNASSKSTEKIRFFFGNLSSSYLLPQRNYLAFPLLNKQRICNFHSSFIYKSKATKLLPFEVDINVTKDVMLFKNEKSKSYNLIAAFGLVQLLFWSYLAKTAAENTIDISREEEREQIKANPEVNPRLVSFWELINFGENKYRYGISALLGGVGYIVTLGSFLYILRSIRYLVLLKGGQFMRIITYAPFGARRITVPLSYVSGQHAVVENKPYYAFRIKGYWFNFLVDMEGEMLDKKLFENTIGVSRSFKNIRK